MGKFITFSLVLVAISFGSCKKCKCSDDSNEDQFLSYWYFGPGSYWVYKADSTEIYDTVTIWYTEIHEDLNLAKGEDYETDGRFYKQCLLHSNHEFYGNYFGSGQEIRSGGRRVKHNDWIMFQNFYAKELGLPVIMSNFLTFDYPYVVGDSLHHSPLVSDVITLSVPAGTFENTVIVKPHVYWYYNGGDTYITDLYMSPNVGTTKIIMYDKTDTVTWSLVDYYAPKYCRKKK